MRYYFTARCDSFAPHLHNKPAFCTAAGLASTEPPTKDKENKDITRPLPFCGQC